MTESQTVTITYTDLAGTPPADRSRFRSADEERFEAICHKANAVRTFRFDRVTAVESYNWQPIDRDTWVKTVSGRDIPYREPSRAHMARKMAVSV